MILKDFAAQKNDSHVEKTSQSSIALRLCLTALRTMRAGLKDRAAATFEI